jgi:Fe-S-cluster containining protein
VIRALSRPHATRWGAPVVDRVDLAIFAQRYFMQCMQCTYCFDSCCAYGVDVDGPNVDRLMAVADELEAFTGIPRDRWFSGEWTDDKEFPGGRQTRTQVVDGACVFRNRAGRGCLIHSFALERGTDYHDLKPMVSVLFPLTFDYGLLHPSNEIHDKSLQCYGDGPTLYQGVRDEVGWYFGQALVDELDELERLQKVEMGAAAGPPGDGLAGQPAAK